MAEQTETVGLEERLGRLEKIVAALERDDLELETALGLFEEGVGHLRRAEALLQTSELRIDRLLEEGEDGSVLVPMDGKGSGSDLG